jgi:hypothetical protein
MHTLESLFRAVIPIVAVGTGLVLLAYYFPLVRDLIRQFTQLVEAAFVEAGGAFARGARSVRENLSSATRLLTHNGRFPLPMLVVAVGVVLPVMLLIAVVELRLWSGYFEGIFPEDIEVPLVGILPGGVLVACVPVLAGFLIGWVVEVMLGAHRLPILGGTIGPDGNGRIRGVLAFGLLALWIVLMVTVYDAANEVYDGLGESTCALQAIGTGSVASSAASVQSDNTEQAACLARWMADDRARSIRIVLGEVALFLSALFSWAVVAGAGLVMLVALCVPLAGLAVLSGLARLCARLFVAAARILEAVLGLLQALGMVLVRVLRWLRAPLPDVGRDRRADEVHAVDGVAMPAVQPVGSVNGYRAAPAGRHILSD